MSRLSELIAELCPDGVEYKALGDVATFGGGHTPSKIDAANYEEGGIWWVTSKDVKSDVLTSTGITLSESGAKRLTLYPSGTLVMVTRSGVLKRLLPIAFLAEPMTVNQDIKAILPNNEIVLSRYLFYFLKASDNDIRERYGKVGGTVDSINFRMVKKYRIPVPPIEVQREVVRILDEYAAAHDELVEQLGREIELVSKQCEIALANLNDDLVSRGYPFEPLGDHADVLSGFPFKSSGYVDEGVPLCGGVSIMPGYIDWTTCRYWSSAENLDQFTLKSGDIVMALDRPWVSGGFKIAQISEDDEGALLVQRTARIRGKDMIQAYVRSLMEMDAFRKHCAATGNTVPHVSHKKIKSYMVPVPPIDEQENYVRKACGITLATNAIVENLIIERAYREQQHNLVRNHLLSFPEKVS